MITRELILQKSKLGLWRVSNGIEECYKITDDGGGYCNSIAEMCQYYDGEEVKLVNIILEKGNDVIFMNIETMEDHTYEEYLAQFFEDKEPLIFPYVDFNTYGKAKEIWDLLMEVITMRTQKDYMNAIKNEFYVSFNLRKDILDAYRYNDHRARDLICRFRENVEKYGLKFSTCYHANGIGNNNEHMIYIETKDADGFVVQKNVANFYYCYGIYGGCYVMLKDLATGKKYIVGRAR